MIRGRHWKKKKKKLFSFTNWPRGDVAEILSHFKLGLKWYAQPTIRYDTRYDAHDTIRSTTHLPFLPRKQRLVIPVCDQKHCTPPTTSACAVMMRSGYNNGGLLGVSRCCMFMMNSLVLLEYTGGISGLFLTLVCVTAVPYRVVSSSECIAICTVAFVSAIYRCIVSSLHFSYSYLVHFPWNSHQVARWWSVRSFFCNICAIFIRKTTKFCKRLSYWKIYWLFSLSRTFDEFWGLSVSTVSLWPFRRRNGVVTSLPMTHDSNKSFQWGSNIRPRPSSFEIGQFGSFCDFIYVGVKAEVCATGKVWVNR